MRFDKLDLVCPRNRSSERSQSASCSAFQKAPSCDCEEQKSFVTTSLFRIGVHAHDVSLLKTVHAVTCQNQRLLRAKESARRTVACWELAIVSRYSAVVPVP